MPQIPDLGGDSLPTPQPALAVARPQPSNLRFAGIPGSFYERAGGELSQAADIVSRTNQQYDTVAAEDGINQLHAKSIDLTYTQGSGFKNVQGSGAIGQQFFDDYSGRLKDAATGISESLANDQQRKLFEQRVPIVANQFRANLLAHQAQETEKFAANTEEGTLKLELGSVAADPFNDVTMQTSLARMNGVLDGRAARTGMPPAELAQQKQQLAGAAWGSRIHAMLDINPYAAEKMLEDHREELGAAGTDLATHVQTMVKQVQQRDKAQQLIFGAYQPYAPADIAPGVQGARPLEGIIKNMESGGERYDRDGNLLTSPKGAQGEMQVMGYTARDPGFGVRPATDNSPEELARVGRDYVGAMTARYDNPALVLAAYNAGPGKVDEWIGKYGDPRTGAISAADWAAKIPFAETRDYVNKGLTQINSQQPQGAIYSGPTARELKTQLPAVMERARVMAQQMYPNDPVFADGLVSRVASYGNTLIAQWTAQQDGARDMLTRGLIGTQPDGSDKPTSIDALLADPRMAEAWRDSTPEVKMQIQNTFKNGGDVPRTAASESLWTQYVGRFTTDRQAFAEEDLTKLIGQMPHADYHNLVDLQMRARNRQDTDADRQSNMIHALGIANDYALRAIKLGPPTATSTQTQRDQYDRFVGAYSQAIDQFTTTNKRPPKDDELISISRNLTTTLTQPGEHLWSTSKDIRAFEVTPDNVGQVRPKAIPPEFLNGIVPALTRQLGMPPTQAQIDTAYILSLRQTPPRRSAGTPAPAAAPPATTYRFPQNVSTGTIKTGAQ